MTALFKSKQISRDLVAFRGCPATSNTLSLIDFGAEDPSLTCSSTSDLISWVKVVSPTHFAINVVNINVGDVDLKIPTDGTWQSGINSQSIVDSCTTVLYIPQFAYKALIQKILDSGVLQNSGMSEGSRNNFLYNLYGTVKCKNIG
jgi:hypothetical protein